MSPTTKWGGFELKGNPEHRFTFVVLGSPARTQLTETYLREPPPKFQGPLPEHSRLVDLPYGGHVWAKFEEVPCVPSTKLEASYFMVVYETDSEKSYIMAKEIVDKLRNPPHHMTLGMFVGHNKHPYKRGVIEASEVCDYCYRNSLIYREVCLESPETVYFAFQTLVQDAFDVATAPSDNRKGKEASKIG
jgi:hypothetical protein